MKNEVKFLGSQHSKIITVLLKNFLKTSGKTDEHVQEFISYLTGWVPVLAAPEFFKRLGLNVSGKEKDEYLKVFYKLRQDVLTEHLKQEDLNQALWGLVKEILENKNIYKDSLKLNERVKDFLQQICKPIKIYEVAFRISNINIDISPTKFWDCLIVKFNRTNLLKWGFKYNNSLDGYVASTFEDKNLIIVFEKGNNPNWVVRRARWKANHRLKMLQNYLKEESVYDVQLQFEISNEYAVKVSGENTLKTYGRNNADSPIIYDYSKFFTESAKRANKDFKSINTILNLTDGNNPIKDIAERTLFWIGKSISESETDMKITALCTALETLLTSISDARKGERLAYRSYLLGVMAKSDTYVSPQDVLWIYLQRNKIIHGAEIGKTFKDHYSDALKITQASLGNFIKVFRAKKLKRQSELFKILLKSRQTQPFLEWLDGFQDDQSKAIAIAIREDKEKLKK